MRHCLILLLMLCCLASRAQLVDFTGHVMEAGSYKPIPNVAVTVDSVDWTFTNSAGTFHLKINDSRKMILFSCIGYRTDHIEIPADRSGFNIQLQREYIQIERIEIDSLSRALQKNTPSHLNKPPARNDIVMDAKYPGGLKHFQYDLSLAIRSDSVNSFRLLKDKLMDVKFEVDASGRMIAENQSNDSSKLRLEKWFSQLKAWEPAIQNRVYVPQYYKMLLTWPELLSGNAVESPVFLVVEEPAMPKGGMIVFYEFVGENLRYPIEAIKKGIVGKVLIEFIVETSGKISHVKVIKGIGGGCDEEAARVVSQSPVWRPGLQRGKPVRQKMIIPIAFNQGTRKWRIN